MYMTLDGLLRPLMIDSAAGAEQGGSGLRQSKVRLQIEVWVDRAPIGLRALHLAE